MVDPGRPTGCLATPGAPWAIPGAVAGGYGRASGHGRRGVAAAAGGNLRVPDSGGVADLDCATDMRGFIDYRMARRAVVRDVSSGRVRITDVCDAHPELLRAARYIGRPAERACPICGLADDRADVPRDEASMLRLVTYVFGDDLKRKSGHVVWDSEELSNLASAHESFMTYTVECCLVCGWNHLVESYLLGLAHAG